jgi:hypothetical protein
MPSTIVVTDASGAWSATAIAAGSYKVTASAVGFLPASASALALASGERSDHVDLALASGGTTVSGTVSDIGGGPIAGARVTMRPESIVDATTGKPLAGLTVLNATASGASSFAAMNSGNRQKTDASGRFELTSQPLGDGRLMVLDAQTLMMPAAGGSTRFTLTAGQRLDLGTIKVTEIPRSTGNTITITSHAPAR